MRRSSLTGTTCFYRIARRMSEPARFSTVDLIRLKQHNLLQSSEGVTIDTSEQNAMYIKMVGSDGRRSSTGGSSIAEECLRRRLSAGDWSLLQLAATPPQRHVPRTGRFLTMHKRRRKRLTTRTLGAEHTAILDDVTHGQVQCILDRCGLWAFNAFALETAAGGRSLSVLCVHLFHWYGLLDHFQLDVVRVWKLFTLIEEGYHSTNPYHNSIHAADVTQAMHCFLQEEKIRKHMTPLEVMASLLGAVAHDLDHPGVNQPFLIATSNHLAALYGNMSVLENHHWRSAVGCLLESGVAEQLTPWRDTLESQIRSLILATDITRQQEFINRLKNGIDDNTLDMRNEEDRHFILQIALKCADISNPTRPWDVSRKWSLKVCEEFFRQGDFERRLNLPVTSLCDRNSTSVPKIQSGFFRFVVTPLFTEWHRFLLSDLSYKMMDLLHSNQKRWEVLEAAENAEETQTELSDAEPEQILSEASSEKGSSETLLPADFIPRQSTPRISSSSRRHSVPVNVARCLLPRSNTRRESLPPQARLPALANDIHHRLVNSNINEGDELLFGSQLSLMSTDSLNAVHHSSSSAPEKEERPLSAETLLPDLSITSMTAVGFTSGPKCLTRQQTFPPLQPYVRARYLSTTAEMSSCREILLEGGSNSNSSHSSEENLDNEPSLRGVSVLSSSNNRGPEMFIAELQYKLPPPVQAQAGNKRGESSERTEKDKASKMAKLSDGPLRGQKENVDPKRNLLNGLARRRGSAPVTSIFNRPEEPIPPPSNLLRVDAGNLRRGSMPADVAPQRSNEQEEVQIDPVLSRITSSQSEPLNCQYPRRGSMPAEIPSELRRTEMITRHCTSLNGKAGRRKKQLRRRSSGGPETVCLLPELSDNAAWLRWRREIVRRSDINPDATLAKRRGSLPIEALSIGNSERYYKHARSTSIYTSAPKPRFKI